MGKPPQPPPQSPTFLGWIRIVRRLVSALLWTVLILIVTAIGYVPLVGSKRLRVRWRAIIVHYWALGVGKSMGMRVRSRGKPPLPPFFLVTNHLSYLDILLVGSRVRAAFVSRADVSGWPFIGFLTRVGGTLFINRRNKKDVIRIHEEMEAIIDAGGGIVFFPEGTTSMGEDVGAFRPPLLELPARLNAPVAYAAIRYETPEGSPLASEAIAWWGSSDFANHALAMMSLPYFEATIDFGPDVVRGSDRKELAAALEERVRERFSPMVTMARDPAPEASASPEDS